jgi:L-malate glycosyltransferase
MNILYICNHLNPGGITSYLLTLASGMKRRGHCVSIASSGGERLSRFLEEGISYIPLPLNTKKEVGLKLLLSFFKASKFLREGPVDILHSNSRTTQVLAHLLSRRGGAKHIFTCHGFFKRRLLRRFFPCWPDAAIAISPSVKEHFIRDLGADEKKISVVHNGIDVEKFKAQSSKLKVETKKALGLKEGPVIGIVARLSDVKGHLYLIRAMPKVRLNFPQAQLLIVGDGKMKRELERAVRELGLAKSTVFLSSVSDTAQVYPLMDLFVMPSLHEGLGLALMEAMASGLACIGTQVGGIPSLIQDGRNGYLVKPADAQGLSEKILRVLSDPQQASSLGEQARVFIRENFSQEKMVTETEEVYSRCLSVS